MCAHQLQAETVRAQIRMAAWMRTEPITLCSECTKPKNANVNNAGFIQFTVPINLVIANQATQS